MSDADNLRVGICDIYFDDVHIGHTTDNGVDFMVDREFIDLLVDQYGTAPLDKVLQGDSLKIKFSMAEVITANIAKALPESRYDTGGSDNKLGIGRDAGYKLSQDAVEVRLHPVVNDADDRDEDIYIWKAVSTDNLSLKFSNAEQRKIEVTMEALVDESRIDGYRLGRVGDDTIS